MVVGAAVAALGLAHVVLIDTFRREVPDNFRALVVVVEVIFVGFLLAVAAAHFMTIVRERSRNAVIESLTEALAFARAVDEVGRITVAQLVGAEVAASALVSVATDEGRVLEPLVATGYPRGVSLDGRDAYGVLPPATTVRQHLELTDPWIEPVAAQSGTAPWIARVPLTSGDEVLGLLLLIDRDPQLIADVRLLQLVGTLVSGALDRARLSGGPIAAMSMGAAAHRSRHELVEATAAELGPALIAVETFAATVADGNEALGTIEDARRLAALTLGVERLSVMMSDLATLGAGPNALVTADPAHVDLKSTLRTVRDALAPAFEARDQELRLELPYDPFIAYASVEAVERLMLHLLSNANRAAPDGGTVTIRATNLGPAALIEVEDSGPALDPAEAEHLFDPFYRVPARVPEVPGAGLGLAVAQRLVEAQRGTIEAVASERGALYRVALPVEEPDPVAVPSEELDEYDEYDEYDDIDHEDVDDDSLEDASVDADPELQGDIALEEETLVAPQTDADTADGPAHGAAEIAPARPAWRRWGRPSEAGRPEARESALDYDDDAARVEDELDSDETSEDGASNPTLDDDDVSGDEDAPRTFRP